MPHADILFCTANVRFGGKADVVFSVQMSAFDPKLSGIP